MRVFLLCCLLGLTACNNDRVRISGRITNGEKLMLNLDEVDVYRNIPADSTILGNSGKFRFSLETQDPCFYQLRLPDDRIIVLFPEPGQHIRITADAENLLPSLKVEGSHGTEQVTKLVLMLNETKTGLDSLTRLYNSARSDSVREKLNKEYQDLLERHRKSSITFILTHYNSLASLYALYQQYQPGSYIFYKVNDMQFFRIVSDSLTKYYPKSKHVKALRAYTDNMINKYKSQVIMHRAQEAGASLPEVALPDMTGDTVTLTSLRGKYVLLAFWTSYNENCVKQNLELKKIYNTYHNKGFEILQVSLDNSQEAWKRSVRFDELPWINVIDTRYPGSVIAGNYNVTEVPANYLIGKDNISILAKNLSPEQLREKLKEIFN